jgi:hypothetical protein
MRRRRGLADLAKGAATNKNSEAHCAVDRELAAGKDPIAGKDAIMVLV